MFGNQTKTFAHIKKQGRVVTTDRLDIQSFAFIWSQTVKTMSLLPITWELSLMYLQYNMDYQ